jgi:putative DNA primase/helicase
VAFISTGERANPELGRRKKHKTPHEKVVFNERVTAERAEAKRQEEEKRARCRKRSEDIWSNGYSADQHPYLLKKNVKAHGVKQLDGELLIPVKDSNGTLHGLQKINPDGDKRFEPATAVKGHFHQIGIPWEEILIAEGYATAATIHEVTGLAAVCASMPEILSLLP